MKKPLEGARVLLVEDEAMIAMSIEELCKEHAILDIKLSDNWTDEFARLLQARRIPFIFATGYASSHQVFEAFGGIRIVEKPYRDSDLIDALSQAIVGSSAGKD